MSEVELNIQDPKVVHWKRRLDASGAALGTLTPLSVQRKRDNSLLFAYIHAEVVAHDGTRIPPIIFLRGDAVLVVPEVVNRKTGEKRFLMVQQTRIADGGLNIEFPAGMVDENIDNPAYVAVKELFEETGITIQEDELFPLHHRPLYSSPGACDEAIHFFGVSISLSDEEYLALQGRLAGCPDEGEVIVVLLRSKEELYAECKSSQAMLAISLFESQQLKNEGIRRSHL